MATTQRSGSALITVHEQGTFFRQDINDYQDRLRELAERNSLPRAFELELFGTFLLDLAESNA